MIIIIIIIIIIIVICPFQLGRSFIRVRSFITVFHLQFIVHTP